jgi:hypothetical protein
MPARTSIFVFDVGFAPERLVADCRDWRIGELTLHPGFFADSRMERALEAGDLDLWLNLPVFYNVAYLEAHPEHYAVTSRGRRAVQDWCHFVCPNAPGYIDRLCEEAGRLASRLQPARISLDFIRQFVFWERVDLDGDYDSVEDGCYCPRCLAAFSRDTGIRLPAEDAGAALRHRHRAAWGAWKTETITRAAARLAATVREAAPHAQFQIKTLPWREEQLEGAILNVAGQDLVAFGRMADALAPMAFAHLLGRDLGWKTAFLEDVRTLVRLPVACYVQTMALFGREPIPAARVAEELRHALAGSYAAVPIFCYDQLVDAPDIVAVVRDTLR